MNKNLNKNLMNLNKNHNNLNKNLNKNHNKLNKIQKKLIMNNTNRRNNIQSIWMLSILKLPRSLKLEKPFMQFIKLNWIEKGFFIFSKSKWAESPNQLLVRYGLGWYNSLKAQGPYWSVINPNNINSHAGYIDSGPTCGWTYKYLKKYPPERK